MILCAIGGNDTYRTLSYLMEDPEFISLVEHKPKIFMGYSDTTVNHLMFQKLHLATYYGLSAIVDFGEFDDNMLPYTKAWFHKMFIDDKPEIFSSPIWYEERTDFSPAALGTSRTSHKESHGYEVLYGKGKVGGNLFGGCLESFGDLLFGDQNEDQKEICKKYELLPQDASGKVIFLETSEEKPTFEKVIAILDAMEEHGLFKNAVALLVGKPQDEAYYDDYKKIYQNLGQKLKLPTLFNLNFGHAHPRCILPIGQEVDIDFDTMTVWLTEPLAKDRQ